MRTPIRATMVLALCLAACGGSDDDAGSAGTDGGASDGASLDVSKGGGQADTEGDASIEAPGADHGDVPGDASPNDGRGGEVVADAPSGDQLSDAPGAETSADASGSDVQDVVTDASSGEAAADASLVEAGLDAPGDTNPADAAICFVDHVTHTGVATAYEVSVDGSGCYLSLASTSTFAGAAATAEYAGSAICGTCALVTGPAGTATVLFTDECPSCNGGAINLTDPAMQAVGGSNPGNFTVTWRAVPCDTAANVTYQFTGTNPYYVHVRFMGHRNPIANVEMALGDGGYAAMSRQTDNYFVLASGTAITAPVTFRLTDTLGQKIQITAASLASGDPVNGAAQFPATCAP